MSGLSQALRLNVLDHFTGVAAWSAPAATWIALYSADASATGAGTELSGSGYDRVQCSAWNAAAASGTVAEATNNGALSFPTATAGWSTATCVGVYNTQTAGTFLAYATITAKTIEANDVVRIADTALKIKLKET